MLDDVRYALRLMARQKAFTSAAILTLALGIGATTAIFSMVYGVLLRPLPYPTADRLVRLSESHPGGTPILSAPMVSNVTYHAWRRAPRTIDGIGAFSVTSFTLLDRGSASRVRSGVMTPAVFAMLGARPVLGRLLHERDAAPGAPNVAVVSAQFWQERLGGDASAVGRTMILDGGQYTIVGVTPPDFYFPDRRVALWTPLRIPETPASGRLSIHAMLAVLRPGMTPEQASAEGTAAARSVGARHMSATLLFGTGGPVTIGARPLLEELTARVRPALVLLLAGVGCVLLIVCANVANLLLSRGLGRGRELAVRTALGAGHGRIVRQLMTETLVLAFAGGALGVALGWALTRVIPALAPEHFPRVADIRLDGMALAFALLASLASGLLAGTLPALRVARGALLPALREGAGASSGPRSRRVGAGLLVAEAAVAVMLLVGAGLLGRSFVRLLSVDGGYEPENVLTAVVFLQPRPDSSERDRNFTEALLERVRALPGVVAAGASNMAPFMPATAVAQITMRGDGAEPITGRTLSYSVTPGYAEALSMRLREGRLFDGRDLTSGIRPLIVNETFARVHFRDGRPVTGRRFTASFAGDATVEIVGVVGDLLKDGLDTAPQPAMFNPWRDSFRLQSGMNLAVRTSGDPLAIAAALHAAVRSIDPTAALDGVRTLESRVSASVAEPRFAMSVLIAFATLAMVLAAVGLYGVLSYQVLQRRREMGVRAALGASRGSIVALVVGEGLRVTTAGVLLGLLGAAWLSRLMAGLLFGVTPHDAVAFGIAPVALILVAIVAAVVPARRAASIDPVEALRSE